MAWFVKKLLIAVKEYLIQQTSFLTGSTCFSIRTLSIGHASHIASPDLTDLSLVVIYL
jgi:hypothetical protein